MFENKLAIASISLGQHPAHPLPSKIPSAAQTEIQGIEIVFRDLGQHAAIERVSLRDEAADVKHLCAQASLQIISFAAFENFERNRSPLSERLEKARQWLDIAQNSRSRALASPVELPKAHEHGPRSHHFGAAPSSRRSHGESNQNRLRESRVVEALFPVAGSTANK